MADTDLDKLVINVGTTAQIEAGISGGTITQDMLSITTDGAGYVESVNNVTPDANGNVTLAIPSEVTESTVAGWGFTKNAGTVTSVNGTSPVNGNVSLSIPTKTSDLTNDSGYVISSDLNTAAYVADNTLVHRSGTEEIAGIKTVTGHWDFRQEQTISNIYATKGTKPTNAQYNSLTFCDKNGTGYAANQLGNVQHKLDTDGTSLTALVAIKNVASSTANASIGVAYKVDGSTYGYAPTPSSATDNSTKIATTAWVRNHRCTSAATTTSSASVDAPAYIVENYSNGSEWYRVWSDGWIEQGGIKATTNGVATVTLHRAMSSASYPVILNNTISTSTDTEGVGYAPLASDRTTTNFRVSSNFTFSWNVCGY